MKIMPYQLTQKHLSSTKTKTLTSSIQNQVEFSSEKYHGAYYAVDIHGRYRKFKDLGALAKFLKETPNNITRQTKSGKSINDYAILKAPDVEVVEVDKDKIEEARKSVKQREVYLIDKNGIAVKYPSIKDAATENNLCRDSISKCVHDRANYVGNFVALRPKDIERKDENGNIYLNQLTIDTAKLVLKHKRKSSNDNDISFSGNYKTHPVYLINAFGEYKKYPSLNAAAQDIGVTYSSIFHAVHSTNSPCVSGYAIRYADDIETVKVDKEKINEAKSKIKERSLYLVDINGSIRKFPTIETASKEMNVSNSSISHSLNFYTYTAEKYVAYRPSQIEMLDSRGNLIINKEIIEEAKQRLQKRFKH